MLFKKAGNHLLYKQYTLILVEITNRTIKEKEYKIETNYIDGLREQCRNY